MPDWKSARSAWFRSAIISQLFHAKRVRAIAMAIPIRCSSRSVNSMGRAVAFPQRLDKCRDTRRSKEETL
jgi:hypothetical protein